MNVLDKQVLLQYMDKREETLKKLIELEGTGSEVYKLQGKLDEIATWKESVESGSYDVKVW